jgi:hypothetical protein
MSEPKGNAFEFDPARRKRATSLSTDSASPGFNPIGFLRVLCVSVVGFGLQKSRAVFDAALSFKNELSFNLSPVQPLD